MMTLSSAGLGFIKHHEGFRSHLYNDATDNATIGYGHLVHTGPVGTHPLSEAVFKLGISETMGGVLLARDARVAISAVQAHARNNLQQHEFDALVSLAFNIGAGAFERSTVLRRVNTLATSDAVESAWLEWDKPRAILPRRRDEVALFLTGNYVGGHHQES